MVVMVVAWEMSTAHKATRKNRKVPFLKFAGKPLLPDFWVGLLLEKMTTKLCLLFSVSYDDYSESDFAAIL